MAVAIRERLQTQIEAKSKKICKLEEQMKSWQEKTERLLHWALKIKANERLITNAKNDVDRIESLRSQL